jgi:hypothetical protein
MAIVGLPRTPKPEEIQRLTNALIELDAAVEGIPRPWQPEVRISIQLSHEWIREVGLKDLGRWADKEK